MTDIPAKYHDLMSKKAFAHVATVLADGSPQVTPVWFDYTNGKVRVNTAKGRTKARTMKPGAKVAVAIMDPDNAYRYVQVRGTVARVTEDGAEAHIDSLSQRYLGKAYPYRQAGDVRITIEITPESIDTMG
ncbi:MAG: PPOX class F420-dependent oxidoreductase [Acetobacteraceae bacterium]